MTDQDWYAECDRNYEALAAELVADGYIRSGKPDRFIPYTFTKGDEVLYLVRRLGSSNWYTKNWNVADLGQQPN